MRCVPVSLQCGPGGPKCPHRSDAETENGDSVYEAIHSVDIIANSLYFRLTGIQLS